MITSCSDRDCCVCGEAREENALFGGICTSSGGYPNTYTCENGQLIMKQYEDPQCLGAEVREWRSGRCYYDKNKKASYFLTCFPDFDGLKANDVIDQAMPSRFEIDDIVNGHNDNVQWYVYLIGVIVVLLALVCGIFGGYLLYKKSPQRKGSAQAAKLLNARRESIN